MKQLLDDHIKIVHLIGIGGISMSALAKILHKNNYQVSGSDFRRPRDSRTQEARSGDLSQPRDQACPRRDLIIYFSAIKDDNPS